MANYDYNGRNIWTGTDGAPVTTYKVDSDRRDIDVSKEISLLVPEATPFISLLMRARKVPVNSTEFIWYDQGAPTWYTQVSGGINDTATTLTVDDGSFFRAKDIIKNTATGEVCYVSAVSGNDLTIVRGYGYDSDTGTGTEATAMSDDDYILRLSNAMEENSNAPDSYVTQPSKFFNYVQTIRTPFDSSMDNEIEGKRAGQPPRIRLRRQKSIEHRIDLEKTGLWGERYEDISNQRKMTGGVEQFITTNSYDVSSTNGGILTEAELEKITETAFKYKSPTGGTKLALTSYGVAGIINQFAAGRIETTSGEETYGLRLKKLTTFNGDLILAPTRLFENDYSQTMMILDMENIEYRPFGKMDTKLRTNIQDNDVDGWKDEYMTKFGIRVRNEETHTLVTGIEA
jgi:hypothetical protein